MSLFERLAAKLNDRPVAVQNEADYFPSAVMLPLVEVNGELELLFEVRSAGLARQPGEICFPGGRIEAGETPDQAAVRETAEELGVPQGSLQLVGPLDYLISPIGVMLYPFAGRISTLANIRPNPAEVDEIFTVPLSWLLAAEPETAFMEVATRPLPGFPLQDLPSGYSRKWRARAKYPVLFYRYEQRVIWGITARVLCDFLRIVRSS